MAKRVLFVIAPKFRDEELLEPKGILERIGAVVTVASTSIGPVRGMLGKVVESTLSIARASAADFDVIVFVGGIGAAELFNNTEALRLAREFAAAGKPVAAICIAPTILANAGVLSGRRATAWPSEAGRIAAVGSYTGADLEVDGRIITAKGPTAAAAFGRAIARALGEES